jgi:hypothetical protein
MFVTARREHTNQHQEALMADEILVNTSVAPDLHPAVIEALADGDETVLPYLKPVQSWFESAYLSLGDLHTARQKGEADQSQTKASVILRVAKAAGAVQDKLLQRGESTLKAINTTIKSLETSLDTPLVQIANKGHVASEIRAHFKGLSVNERQKALQDAHARGDTEVMGAILGAPAILSGMTEEARSIHTRMWNEKAQREVSKRLNALTKARDHLERRLPLVLPQIMAAVGASWQKVNDLKAASNDFEASLILNRFDNPVGS